jgi:hypothetical protein
MILKWKLEVELEEVNWTNLAQGRDSGRALVNTVMKFQFSQNRGGFINELRNCEILKKDSALWNYNII